jgi:hypothetical protein
MTSAGTFFLWVGIGGCLLACSDTGAEAATGGGGDSSSPFLGSVDPGSPHTPATGCKDGYVACGEVCADVTNDARHCGGCDQACASTCSDLDCGCAGGMCIAGQGCPFGPTCGGVCLEVSAYANADHCGGCDNRCGDVELCIESACVESEGDGTSCASPLFWNVDAETAGFRMSPAVTSPHTFTCGPLDSVPTRWFRVTAQNDGAEIEVSGHPADDFVIEIFSDAACDDGARLGCGDAPVGEEDSLDIDAISEGKTYWVAVGIKGTWSGTPAMFHIDH